MQLLIKQRVFSWTDTYDVYDENEEPKYFVKAEFFTLGHQIHVYDKAGNEVGMVKQRLLTLLPAFDIEIGGKEFGSVQKEFSFLSRGMNWITTAGGARATSWHGSMMCMRRAAQWYISRRNHFNGAIPMCWIFWTRRTRSWR